MDRLTQRQKFPSAIKQLLQQPLHGKVLRIVLDIIDVILNLIDDREIIVYDLIENLVEHEIFIDLLVIFYASDHPFRLFKRIVFLFMKGYNRAVTKEDIDLLLLKLHSTDRVDDKKVWSS